MMSVIETVWVYFALGGALVLIATLVNRHAADKRFRIRRVATTFGLYLVLAGLAAILQRVGADAWARRLDVGARILESFTVIGLIAISFFDLLLPRARIVVVSITTDLLVGVAYIVSTLAVLSGAGMDPSSVVATSAIVSGIIALSLQTTLGNILGGVALELDGSIHVGDWLQLANGRQGKVKAIRWRHTVLETRDWDTIIVPNATLLSSEIVILGKREGAAAVQHRMTFNFNVDFRFTPAFVIDMVNEALRATPIEGVAADPPPHCLIHDLAKDGRDSFGYYLVRYWLIDLDRDDGAQSRVRSRVYTALRRAGVPLARPNSTVYFTRERGDDDVRTRAERLAALAKLGLFDTLTSEQREILADHLRYAPFSAGEVIVRTGQEAHWMHVLVSGKVEVRTGSGALSRVVASIAAPNFFGEMGLMTGEPRSADVVASTEVETYRLDRYGFEQILLPHPDIAKQISAVLARRRVELLAAREGLDADSKRRHEETEQKRILERIQDFFGLIS